MTAGETGLSRQGSGDQPWQPSARGRPRRVGPAPPSTPRCPHHPRLEPALACQGSCASKGRRNGSRGRGGKRGRERRRGEPAGEVAASRHAQQRVRRLLRQDAAPAHHEYFLRVRARICVRGHARVCAREQSPHARTDRGHHARRARAHTHTLVQHRGAELDAQGREPRRRRHARV